MTDEELWDKLDKAAFLPDRKQAKEAVVALLQQAYEEDLTLIGAAVPNPEDPTLFDPMCISLGRRVFFTVFTQVAHSQVFYREGLDAYDSDLMTLGCRSLLDSVFDEKDVHGLAFNPTGVGAGLIIRKADLTFEGLRAQYSAIANADSSQEKA